jgi:hypothetical protein
MTSLVLADSLKASNRPRGMIVRRIKRCLKAKRIAPDVYGVRDAVSAATGRCGFSPEALQVLDQTIEEVWSQLVDDAIADDDRALLKRDSRRS